MPNILTEILAGTAYLEPKWQRRVGKLAVYLRFVRLKTVAGTRSRAGFFTAAYELQRFAEIDANSRAELDNILAWFRKNLAIPTDFNRSKSKGAFRRRETRGLSWFKPTAERHLAKAFDLTDLLSKHGFHIEVLKSHRPGYVIYEDDVQIVAEPFADTPGG